MLGRSDVTSMTRIYLAPPDVGEEERALLLDAFDSGWVAPLGPHVDAFEKELADFVGVSHAAALSSGTAALHLALLLVGVQPGDDVLLPSLTFVATPNAVRYVGAHPVLIDSSERTWTLDPDLLLEELAERKATGRRVGAVIAVDLYGQCADYDRIEAACAEYDVPLVEDAAEALGATYRGRQAGSFGRLGVFSFNGNKIITTAGGGMLVGRDPQLVAHARSLSTQARIDVPHYEHDELGFNYRMSNLLAAVGRGQLRRLDSLLAGRRTVESSYRAALGDVPGIGFLPVADYGQPSYWLSVITVDPEQFGADRDVVRDHLDELDIETRPAWKPMHLQPLYRGADRRGGAVADAVWRHGLCLPSGNRLNETDLERIVDAVRSCRR
jgi:dTDP-4-amino-4,6-dideoxygalactose transaminase